MLGKKSPVTSGRVGATVPKKLSLSTNAAERIKPSAGRRRLFLWNESTTYKARVNVGAQAADQETGFPLFPSGAEELEVNDEQEVTIARDQAAATAGATVTVWVYEEYDRG
jgi:hypothetical protein